MHVQVRVLLAWRERSKVVTRRRANVAIAIIVTQAALRKGAAMAIAVWRAKVPSSQLKPDRNLYSLIYYN